MDSEQTPEQIRAKRLASLAKFQSSRESSPSSSSSQTSNPIATSSGSPPAKIVKPPVTSPVTKIAPKSPSVSSTSPNSSAVKQVNSFLEVSTDVWLNRNVENILQLTLNKESAISNGLIFLSSLYEEFKSESQDPQSFTPPKLQDNSIIDQCLSARLLLPENADEKAIPLLDYLISCWKRAANVIRVLDSFADKAADQPTKQKVQVLASERRKVIVEVKELLVNYSGLVLMPELADCYPQKPSISAQGPTYLAQKLLSNDGSEDIPKEFFSEFFTRHDGDGFDQFFVNTVVTAMRNVNITTDYRTPLNAFEYLLSFKQLLPRLIALPSFNPPNTPPKSIEILTLLGPFFSRTSAFPDIDAAISKTYFGSTDSGISDNTGGLGIGNRNLGEVKTSANNLRTLSKTITNSLHDIVMTIIRSGSEQKEAVLQYFFGVLNSNLSRGKMQVDRREVSSDGFFFNMLRVCLRLCDPILDPGFKKIHLIDPYYLITSKRFDVRSETRLCEDESSANEFFDKIEKELNAGGAKSPNFVSDVFYLTLMYHHYGVISTFRFYGGFVKDAEELKNHVDRMTEEQQMGPTDPMSVMRAQMLKRFQTQLDTVIAHKLCYDAALLDPDWLQHSLSFYNLVMMWLIRVIHVGNGTLNHAQATKGDNGVDWNMISMGYGKIGNTDVDELPEVPKLFATLPEWIVEDICEFYLFVCKHRPTVFEHLPRNEFMTFSMLMLKNPTYLKNPYLKSKLVEILFYFTIPLWRTASGETLGRLDAVFSTHVLAKKDLVSWILKFYVDVEQTGMSSQFYDKFNIRYNISQIVKKVWTDPGHHNKMIELSRNVDFFVKFVNLLMNDTTYLLDESLAKLTEIRNIQNEMESPGWNTATQQHRQEREGLLRTSERQATSYMSLGVETVHMLKYLTAEERIVEPFMQAYIVERLAAMLDFNLAAMVGPRCTELKVKNPEKYRFNPKSLLNELIDIFMHLAHRQEFIVAVAKDGRSYKKEHFYKSCEILLRVGLKREDECERIRQFVQSVENAIAAENEEEEELGEIPDEFLDPLMYTLMEDPVILPTSRVTMDRSTIKSHLLSDQRDPINRMPLTIDMVVDNVELKQKIAEWRRDKKKNGVAPMEM